MHFFVIYRHSWPDTSPYAHILEALTERLRDSGHVVTVFCGQPSYNDIRHVRRPRREVERGVVYVRMPLLWERKRYSLSRVLNAVLFGLGAFLYGLVIRKIDVALTATTPPIIPGLAARYLASVRKCRFVYHCQDILPEAALAGGVLRESVFTRFMSAVETNNFRGADPVIVLSDEMADSLRARGINGANVEVLNNFARGSTAASRPLASSPHEALRKQPGIFRLLFAGNHGRLQGLEDVIAAAHILRSRPDIHFQFVGEGIARPRLIEQAANLVGKTVFFHPQISEDDIMQVVAESDLGIVSLRPGIYRYAYPSKVGTLLASGCPILAIIEAESSLARFVSDENVGLVCEPGDVKAIVNAIETAYLQGSASYPRDRIRAAAAKHFGEAAALDRLSGLLVQSAAHRQLSGAKLKHTERAEAVQAQ